MSFVFYSNLLEILMRYFLLLLATCFLFIGCSKDPTEPDNNLSPNPTAADSVATYWFEELTEEIEGIEDADDEEEYIRSLDFSPIRSGFEYAVELDISSGLAHLGLSLVGFFEINSDDELWAVIDSLQSMDLFDDNPVSPSWGNPLSNGILGHQFKILAESPLFLMRQTSSVPSNITVPHLQEIIRDNIIPKLSTAITEIELAEADLDFNYETEIDGDIREFDLGEVYFFDSSLRALRAGLRIMIAYDMDLADMGGSYDWLEEENCTVDEWQDGNTLHVFHPSHVYNDSLVAANFKNILEEGSDFMTLNNDTDNQLELAYDDLSTLLIKLEETAQFIRTETDPQGNDIIEFGYLTDLDDDINNCEGCPNFASGWTQIEQVIAWAEAVLTGPYDFSEEIDGTQIDITINISTLFNSPVEDLKTLLPLHQWADNSTWLDYDEFEIYCYEWSHDGSPLHGEHDIYYDIFHVEHCWQNYYGEFWPVDLVDDNGYVIDGEETLPYFPDYTFGDLFPSMDRQQWSDIFYD
jgi:hypothetical protein